MKILFAPQIRSADAYTIEHEPVASIALMERAANAFVRWFIAKFDREKKIIVVCGLGNNGGDGLAIARLLHQRKYKVEVVIIRHSDHCSEDFLLNEKRLKKIKAIPVFNLYSSVDLQSKISFPKSAILIDAIFGSGLNRPVEGLVKKVIQQINDSGATVVAVDVPSGMFSDVINQKGITAVRANYTVTFELPKLPFLFPENYQWVGEWEVVAIGLDKKIIEEQLTANFYITEEDVRKIMKPRKKINHKGTFGHALLIAGSYGKMGAAVLAAKACLMAGAGLTTVHLPRCGYQIMQRSLPEAMVSIDKAEKYFTGISNMNKYNTIGVGPGLGTQKPTQKALLKLLQSVKTPLVLDADALNILGENKKWLKFLSENSILTPHPKEFERLAGKSKNDEERHQKQKDFAQRFRVYLILKTAHTCIATPDGRCFFNSTGNPGMAKGGSGDVLTGILTGLLAQKYSSEEACILGVYLHGLAGDIAAGKKSQPAMLASDIVENLGEAFKKIKAPSVSPEGGGEES